MSRLAFVIGISDYIHRKKLNNAEGDARAIANVLKSLRFEVIELYNCTIAEAKDTYYDILNKLIDKYEAIVFYFAGHGEIINSTDCILMKDTPLKANGNDVKPRAYSLSIEEIMKDFNGCGDQTNILIIDACRVSQGIARGFAPTNTGTTIGKIPYQTFIAFSTAPGDTAPDGKKGEHSPFAKSLLSHILDENLDIEFLFKKVRGDVKEAGYPHYPWEHSCLVGRFCFNYGNMNKYHDLPYDKSAYIRSQYQPEPGSAESEIIEKLQSKDVNEQKAALNLLLSNHQSLNGSQKFHLGRILYSNATLGSKPCNEFLLKSSNLRQTKTENENHLLRGIYYEIFFDENDKLREKAYGNTDILTVIESKRTALQDKDSENFVLGYLPKEQNPKGYVLGGTMDHKFNIKLSNTELFDYDWRRILQLEDIKLSNKSIFAELRSRLDNLLIDWTNLRYALADLYGLPLQKVILNPSIAKDGTWNYVSFADEIPDIHDFLEEICRDGTPSEIDVLSSLSYIEDVEDYTVTEIFQNGDDITVHGSLNVSVHLEYDGEDAGSMSFPGDYSIALTKGNDNQWILQKRDSHIKIDTERFYE